MRVVNLKKWGVLFLNGAASSLPDDTLGGAIRVCIYSMLGVSISKNTYICGGQYINGSNIRVGSRVFINRGCYFDITGSITIHDDVVIGHGVTFVTAEHEVGPSERRAGSVNPGPIVIESGVWIGANVTILPNVNIGSGSIIAAGAVVNKSVPSNSLYGGVPAKFIKNLD